jgi:hypothetical protein
MGTSARTVGFGVLLTLAVALPGCRQWRVADDEPTRACPCKQRSVLAELGQGADQPAGTSGDPTAPGPSLVAGDAIAMNWGFAFGIAPRGHSASWVLVGLRTD